MGNERIAGGADEGLDRNLLLRAAERWPAAKDAESVDAMEIAAYLDGRLGEAERDRFEGRLARDEDALSLWLAADEALGARDAVPDRLVERAQALAPKEQRLPPQRRSWIAQWLASQRPLGGFGWATAALLFLVVCYGGFELGQAGYEATRDGETQTAALAGSPFGPDSIF